MTKVEITSLNYSFPYKTKSDWKIHVLFQVIFCPIIIIMMYGLIRNGSSIDGGMILIILIALDLLLAMILIFSGIFTMYEDRFVYRRFLKKTELLYSDIQKMVLDIPLQKPGVFLRVYTKSRDKEKELNVKSLSEKSIVIVINIILEKNPSVEIDTFLQKIKNGEFKGLSKTELYGKEYAKEVMRRV